MSEPVESLEEQWAQVLCDISHEHMDEYRNVSQEGMNELGFAFSLVPYEKMVGTFMCYANKMFPIDVSFANC